MKRVKLLDNVRAKSRKTVSFQIVPPTVIVAILYVGLVRLIHLVAIERYPPYPKHVTHLGALTAHGEFWQGEAGPTTLLGTLTVTSLLFVLLLWLKLRDPAKAARRHRRISRLAIIGTAILLASLQYALVAASRAEPSYDFVRLEEPFERGAEQQPSRTP